MALNFNEYVLQMAKAVVLRKRDEINGISAEAIEPYLISSKYGRVLSTTGLWETYLTSSVYVMSDFVALDSPLPIKKRPSLKVAQGEIPKLGSMRTVNERTQKEINRLLKDVSDAAVRQAASLLIADIVACQMGIYETLEGIAYQTLSHEGMAVYAPTNVPADLAAGAVDNVGIGIQTDFGLDPLNKLNPTTIAWNDAVNSTPVSDIDNIVMPRALAAGIVPREVVTDLKSINLLLNSKELKENMAGALGVFVPGATVGKPTLEQLNAFAMNKWGFTFIILKHPFMQERDGKQVPIDMWKFGAFAFMGNSKWGDVVWQPCVEGDPASPMGGRVAGRNYFDVDPIMTLAMWNDAPYNASWMSISQGFAEALTVTDCSQMLTFDALTVKPTA